MKTLLLTSNYEPLNFPSERHLYKLLYKDKVEILESWNVKIEWGNTLIDKPSLIRLKEPIHNFFKKNNFKFSRDNIFRRDKKTCQYCFKVLTYSQLTIDHVIPKSFGGESSYFNCVVCCKNCNSVKGHKLLHEVGFKLLKSPSYPFLSKKDMLSDLEPQDRWHKTWFSYLK